MSKADDVKNILDTRREFTLETPDGGELTYFISNPSGEDIRKADWQYSKVYNQAIVDDFLTQAQMLDLLKKKNIVSDDYTAQVEETRLRLAAELFKLENIPDDADQGDSESIAIEIGKLRDDLFTLNQKVNGPMGNTCENLAEDARIEFLTSRIIQKKDGSKLWETFEDYKQEENTALAVKSRFEVMLWMQGLDSDFMETTPEQIALRKIQQKKLDDALAELEKNQEKEDEESAKGADDNEAKVTSVEEPVEELELPKEKVKAPKTKKEKTAKKKPGRPRKNSPKKE